MVEVLIVFVILWSSCGIAILWYIIRWNTSYMSNLTERTHEALARSTDALAANTEATNSLMSELRAIKRYVHAKHGRGNRNNGN